MPKNFTVHRDNFLRFLVEEGFMPLLSWYITIKRSAVMANREAAASSIGSTPNQVATNNVVQLPTPLTLPLSPDEEAAYQEYAKQPIIDLTLPKDKKSWVKNFERAQNAKISTTDRDSVCLQQLPALEVEIIKAAANINEIPEQHRSFFKQQAPVLEAKILSAGQKLKQKNFTEMTAEQQITWRQYVHLQVHKQEIAKQQLAAKETASISVDQDQHAEANSPAHNNVEQTPTTLQGSQQAIDAAETTGQGGGSLLWSAGAVAVNTAYSWLNTLKSVVMRYDSAKLSADKLHIMQTLSDELLLLINPENLQAGNIFEVNDKIKKLIQGSLQGLDKARADNNYPKTGKSELILGAMNDMVTWVAESQQQKLFMPISEIDKKIMSNSNPDPLTLSHDDHVDLLLSDLSRIMLILELDHVLAKHQFPRPRDSSDPECLKINFKIKLCMQTLLNNKILYVDQQERRAQAELIILALRTVVTDNNTSQLPFHDEILQLLSNYENTLKTKLELDQQNDARATFTLLSLIMGR